MDTPFQFLHIKRCEGLFMTKVRSDLQPWLWRRWWTYVLDFSLAWNADEGTLGTSALTVVQMKVLSGLRLSQGLKLKYSQTFGLDWNTISLPLHHSLLAFVLKEGTLRPWSLAGAQGLALLGVFVVLHSAKMCVSSYISPLTKCSVNSSVMEVWLLLQYLQNHHLP